MRSREVMLPFALAGAFIASDQVVSPEQVTANPNVQYTDEQRQQALNQQTHREQDLMQNWHGVVRDLARISQSDPRLLGLSDGSFGYTSRTTDTGAHVRSIFVTYSLGSKDESETRRISWATKPNTDRLTRVNFARDKTRLTDFLDLDSPPRQGLVRLLEVNRYAPTKNGGIRSSVRFSFGEVASDGSIIDETLNGPYPKYITRSPREIADEPLRLRRNESRFTERTLKPDMQDIQNALDEYLDRRAEATRVAR